MTIPIFYRILLRPQSFSSSSHPQQSGSTIDTKSLEVNVTVARGTADSPATLIIFRIKRSIVYNAFLLGYSALNDLLVLFHP
jgi:hypothetical protein